MIRPTEQKPKSRWIGRKTKAWNSARRKLKARFLKLGIVSCELRYEGCSQDNFLTWAHGKRRRFLSLAELEDLVVLACQNCHTILDLTLSHEETERRVREVIAQRHHGTITL
jgi:hypothetical protein